MTREARHDKREAQRSAEEGRHAGLRSPSRLSDADLLCRVVVLAAAERGATVELVAHLAELDARKLYLGEGCGSLFAYCTGVLRLAEHAAFNRIQAARASREFPAILDLLADGWLNLSTVRLIAPHLRPDNFEAVVAMARGRSKRDVEVLVARLAPRPDVASTVRKLPIAVHTTVTGTAVARTAPGQPSTPSAPASGTADDLGLVPPIASAPGLGEPFGHSDGSSVGPGSPASLAPTQPTATSLERPAHRPVVVPLAPERYRVQFTVGEATREKLRRAQDLLRREIPDGDPGAIFDRALTLLLEDVARKKLAETPNPRPCVATGTTSRHVPASVKRAVWIRDGGRCAFVGPNGRRCVERAFLEFHHREPYAIGGEATVGNIALRCRRHNAYEAVLDFGSGVVSAARESRTGRGHSPRGESCASDRGARSARHQDVAASAQPPSHGHTAAASCGGPGGAPC